MRGPEQSIKTAEMSHTDRKPVNPYLKTKVMTASPAELRLMLLDGAIKFAEAGRDGLAEKNYEKSFTNISRAEDIVMELLESLRPDAEPSLCEKLKSLYVFLYLELVRASSEKDIVRIEEVIRLLRYERETWQMAMDKLAGEGTTAGASTQQPQNVDAVDEAAPQQDVSHRSLSISG